MADFLGFMDMIDGGGAGMSGPKFEGGGLLSSLGNAMFSPYGSKDRQQQAMQQAQGQPMQGQMRPMQQPAPAMQPQPGMMAPGPQPEQITSIGLGDLEALMQSMRAAGILPPAAPQMDPRMRQGPF
jgi:hypothetical protein